MENSDNIRRHGNASRQQKTRENDGDRGNGNRMNRRQEVEGNLNDRGAGNEGRSIPRPEDIIENQINRSDNHDRIMGNDNHRRRGENIVENREIGNNNDMQEAGDNQVDQGPVNGEQNRSIDEIVLIMTNHISGMINIIMMATGNDFVEMSAEDLRQIRVAYSTYIDLNGRRGVTATNQETITSGIALMLLFNPILQRIETAMGVRNEI